MYKNRLFKDILDTDKIISKLIMVLFIVLFVLIIKVINTKPTNKLVSFIERDIYYDFSIKDDGEKVGKYFVKFINNSKENFEKFTVEIIDNMK